MINAGTVAAYLTLDTSDFVKGIAAAGQKLTEFKKEQSNGFDSLSAMIGGLGSQILKKVNEMVNSIGSASAFGSLPDKLKSKGSLAAQGLMNGLLSLRAVTLNQFNGMIGAVSGSSVLAGLPSYLKNKGAAATQGLMNGLTSWRAATLRNFNAIISAVSGSAVLAGLPSHLKSKGSAAIQGLIGGMTSRSGSVSSSVRSMVNAAKSAAGNISFTSVGTNMINGMIAGLNNRKSSLMAKARSIASSVSSVIKSALKINSPSRVMMEIGEFTTQGMELGLTKGAARLYDTAAFISNETAAALSGVSAAAWDSTAPSGAVGGSAAYELYRALDSGDRLERLIDAVERLAASQSTVEIDGRPFGRLVREYV